MKYRFNNFKVLPNLECGLLTPFSHMRELISTVGAQADLIKAFDLDHEGAALTTIAKKDAKKDAKKEELEAEDE